MSDGICPHCGASNKLPRKGATCCQTCSTLVRTVRCGNCQTRQFVPAEAASFICSGCGTERHLGASTALESFAQVSSTAENLAAESSSPGEEAAQSSSTSNAARLSQLADFHRQGVLSDDEFEAAVARVVAVVASPTPGEPTTPAGAEAQMQSNGDEKPSPEPSRVTNPVQAGFIAPHQ
jgi:hypothetical protein